MARIDVLRVALVTCLPLFTLAACGDAGAGGEQDGESSTSDGTGDGDPTTGDGDGDGDPTVGDGDGDPTTGDGDGDPFDPNEMIPPPDEEGCHAIYAQDLLPTFELKINPVVWQLLQDQWNNGAALEAMGQNPKTYHPLDEFRYGDIVIYDAEIRLRGNPDYWDPLPGDKMQFQIGFHTNDPDGRFLGIKRLCFDAATYNRHMLRDRLALRIMREAGIKAPCANNARLVINDEYYGIFVNVEKLDEIFLERNYEDPSGDLWKRASWELKTNVDTATTTRLNALKNAATIETLENYLNVDQALLTFATEAVIPDSDGPWAGGLNYYVYDDPQTGKFDLLPWDLDNTFERFDDPPDGDYPTNPDPVVWEKPTTWGRPWYDIALSEPAWFDVYIGLIGQVYVDAYDIEQLHAWIDEWTAQIEPSVLEDMNKPYSDTSYYNNVQKLHDYVDSRHTFLGEWLSCWQNGGTPDPEGYCVP